MTKSLFKEVTLNEKKYSELIEIKNAIEKMVDSLEKEKGSEENGFLNAFGILKNDFKEDSLRYISKLRTEWRK